MKMKLVLACVLAVAVATPALAEYYVVQNSKTHKCSVASKKAIEQKQDAHAGGRRHGLQEQVRGHHRDRHHLGRLQVLIIGR